MTRAFTFDDEGKEVVTTDGDVVGSVVRIEAGDAHVRPRAGLLDGCGSWLSGPWDERGVFRLDAGRVERITRRRVVIATAGGERPASRRERREAGSESEFEAAIEK
ncbi:hypothetical protein [Halosegnis marinus]|uniref:PRC-barrel domain-containing protein n=1 Tax=Halosegnis marinus TaxID=3034023 RepID=A0ABD5ZQF1_9EURY|nr:hypothetical protein [Halosegnis sp. DT85]